MAAAEAEAELSAFENKELEPFIKPICDIFLEVFELNRGNNWLRGRAVVVVLRNCWAELSNGSYVAMSKCSSRRRPYSSILGCSGWYVAGWSAAAE